MTDDDADLLDDAEDHAAPREVAPMLTEALGDNLARPLAEALRGRPALALRLALAPPRVVHCVAAYLHHARALGLPAREVAAALEARPARALLAEAVPSHHPRLWGVLARLPERRAFSDDFYWRLDDALSGPAAEVLLRADRVDAERLRVAEAAAAEPFLVAAALAPTGTGAGATRHDIEGLASVLALLRAHGAAAALEAPLPDGAGWRAVARRAVRALGALRPPGSPPCPAPAPWVWVEDAATLLRRGRRLGNCVASSYSAPAYMLSLAEGSKAYLWREGTSGGGGPLLATLRRVGPALWILGEVSGERNAVPPAKARARLLEGLRAGGLAMVPADPGDALGDLLYRAERPRRGDDAHAYAHAVADEEDDEGDPASGVDAEEDEAA